MVPPGLSFPSRSAFSIIARPMRSLTEPPGFRSSSFASSFGSTPRPSASSRTIGVLPTSSSTEGYSLAIGGSLVRRGLLSVPRDLVVEPVEQARLEALEERVRLRAEDAAAVRLDVAADVVDALDDQGRLNRGVLVREDDVRNVRHHGRAQAEWAGLDRREEDGVVMPLPQLVAAALQRLQLRVGELRAQLALTGPSARDHPAVDRDDGADRILAGLARRACLRERLAHHRLGVALVHAGIVPETGRGESSCRSRRWGREASAAG